MTALAIEAPTISLQVNATTQAPYLNSNQILLQIAQVERGYTSNEWLTFHQAIASGRVVRKGERGVRLMRPVGVIDKKTGKPTTVPRTFSVFNVEQTDPLPTKDAK